MNNSRPFLRLSVHQLVDFLLRKGDIDNRVYNQETMNMGSLLHSSYQKKQGREYLSEYPLSCFLETEDGTLALEGRADGIIIGGDCPVIDEIKSTVMPLDAFFSQQKEWHLGQAVCYAYMYLEETHGDRADVQLTYLSQIDSKASLRQRFSFTKEELEQRVRSLAKAYFAFESQRLSRIAERDASVKNLPFPYGEFREGQRELCKCIYGLCKRGGLFYAEAPTGIGKTISTLYPAVLSFDHSRLDRIFYLTAKNSGAVAAYEAMGQLYSAGLKARDSFLVAKDKICFNPGHACNPDDCPFAKDYYTKLKDALNEARKKLDRFDSLGVKLIASKFEICSFEFQLDLSLESDVVICDYNYFFDPRTKLQRYFDDGVDASKDLILIDEAHNLVDRGREMYSSVLTSESALKAKKALKGRGLRSFQNALKKIADRLEALSGENGEVKDVDPDQLLSLLENVRKKRQDVSKEDPGRLPTEVDDFCREAGKFKLLCERYLTPNVRVFARQGSSGPEARFDCIDASSFLKDSTKKVLACGFFSATLSPIDYYMSALTGDSESPYLLLPSPFPKDHLCVSIASNVSTRYKDRDATLEQVASYLEEFTAAKTGNYFLYFPSYVYLEKIQNLLDFGQANVVIQEKNMTQDERQVFLEQFQPNPTQTTIGLLTLGGVFGEGVDLTKDRLIGVAVVGVGLPQIGFQNDLIRDYYDKKSGKGYDYAYRYPGMNKITQAVGRLIRSPEDWGAALLIDDRYTQEDYRAVFGRIWPQARVVTSPKSLAKHLSSFYKKEQK